LRGFRDRLRADAALVAAYVAAKKAILADGCTDLIDYCNRKGEFATAPGCERPWTAAPAAW
jgi:hypothetical protein